MTTRELKEKDRRACKKKSGATSSREVTKTKRFSKDKGNLSEALNSLDLLINRSSNKSK